MSHALFEEREKCPACDSLQFWPIYTAGYDIDPIRGYIANYYSSLSADEFKYLEGAKYVLSECDDCGLIFQKDIPNHTLMARLYGHWIDPVVAFERHQQDGLAYYSQCAQEIMQIIAYTQKNPSSLSFLDFGMGWGSWALMAKAFGCDSYGAELSVERIEHAKNIGINVIDWEDIPRKRFDFINTEQVFEHIAEPLRTLRHLKAALKDDGIIKVSVPGANDILRRLRVMDWNAGAGSRNSLNPVAPLEHINCFQRASIVKMANIAEMEEVFVPAKIQYRYMTNWAG